MTEIDNLKDSVADMLIDAAKRRRLELAKQRRQRELDYARRAIEASRPKETERRVVA